MPKKGHNSPIIWGDKLFIAGADARTKTIYCYNRVTGSVIWQKEADNIPGSPVTPPKTTDDTGLSAPTMTTDGINLYAIFGTGDIIAFDMDGNRLWAKNIGLPDNHYGHSSSLISLKEKLFVQFDTRKGGKLISLNGFTGETVWEKTRNSKISWASPILIPAGNSYHIILTSDPGVAAYNTENGDELWFIKCLTGEVGPSAAFGEGLVFAANEYATLAAIDPQTKSIVWESNEYLPEVASPV
ncbi:MAG: PQQ-binding-like beta-propeller repeat protein, partial [Bacteroidales bacterium]|nr:PQQ-binding-like beta-propeller repeat protein [Bacteroidales bacterium]